MARKNVVPAFPLIENGDLSGDITSAETNIQNLDKASIHITWDIGGTPVGVITIEAKQVKSEKPEESSDWFTLDLGSTITIDNTDTDHQILLNELPFTHIRLKYTSTSGTGTINATLTSKQVGG